MSSKPRKVADLKINAGQGGDTWKRDEAIRHTHHEISRKRAKKGAVPGRCYGGS